MVHSFANDDEPVIKVVTVPAPPQVVHVVGADGMDDDSGDLEATRGCDRDRKKKKRKKKRRRPRSHEDGGATTADADDGLRAGIRCHAGHCAIGRTAFDTMRKSPDAFARQLRIVPSYQDGEMNGLKLYGIRSGTTPALLGLKNGDLVTQIAGVKLDSMKRLMSLSSDLYGADTVNLEVLRKGETLYLSYEIR